MNAVPRQRQRQQFQMVPIENIIAKLHTGKLQTQFLFFGVSICAMLLRIAFDELRSKMHEILSYLKMWE